MSASDGHPHEAPPSELRVDARRNQQRILLAAARLLADDPAVSIQRIADEAQVARPTVYRRYPTREALVEAIRGEAVGEFSRSLEQANSAIGGAAEAIGLLVRSLAELGAKYPILFQGTDTAHRAATATPGEQEEQEEQAEQEEQEEQEERRRTDTTAVVERFNALILRGQREGTVRTDLAPEILRHSVLGALSASLRLTRTDPPGTGLTAPEVGAQIATLLVEGLRPPR
ncbi:TetR/AcrR family transcriptional regulator [Kitasatospora sp. NPDC008050]|uniref:TetR/AcrR family transcriptional regulator n=1 Tax=Kitasatospora sp. NPDC008050 TaxID=3364021 RepID=UPI0036E4CE6C